MSKDAIAYVPTSDPLERVYRPLWPVVKVWADGSVYPNPGRGGYAAIVQTDGTERVVQGSEDRTTNQRMELMGIIAALEILARPCRVTANTDSLYVVHGCTTWVFDWARHNWKGWGARRSDGKVFEPEPLPNVDLWRRYWDASRCHAIEPAWVPGHSGDAMNERADALAREARVSAIKRRVSKAVLEPEQTAETEGR